MRRGRRRREDGLIDLTALDINSFKCDLLSSTPARWLTPHRFPASTLSLDLKLVFLIDGDLCRPRW